MSTPTQIPVLTITLVVAGTGTNNVTTPDQFTFVMLDSDGRAAACSKLTDKPIGVIQEKRQHLQAAEVMILGVSKIKAGGAIAEGADISTDASGEAVTSTTSGHYIIGTALEAHADGDVGAVLINGIAPPKVV